MKKTAKLIDGIWTRLFVLVFVMLSCLSLMAVERETVVGDWYVDASTGDDGNDGKSWADAFATIQAAIDVAEVGETVVVNDGTYPPINSADKKIVILTVNGSAKTVIDGGGVGRCATLGETANTKLMGFTLRNGYAANGGGAYYGTLSNCWVVSNIATANGGAAWASKMQCCIVSNNTSRGQSGGLEQCDIDRCLVVANYVTGKGVFAGASRGVARNSIFKDNYSTGSYAPGGVYAQTLDNCLVCGNEGWGAQQCTLRNCTVYGNTSGGALYGMIENCIVWNNDVRDAECQFSCVEGGVAGKGNISLCPQFVDPENDDFRLRETSPCIDHGNNVSVNCKFDLAGNARIVNGIVDMGVYEFQPFHIVFDLGVHGIRAGGGALDQSVGSGGSALAPFVRSDIGWKFVGWDKDFSSVTSDMTVTALYEETYCKITMESEYGPTVEETVGYGTNYLFVAPKNYVAEPGVVEYACLGTTYTAPVVGPRFEMTVTNDISFKWDIWSTNYVYEVEPNVPMKIDQEWLKKHISEEFKSLPHSQIIGSMNGQGKNGWPLWESYIMGIDPDKDTVTIEIEAPQTDDPDKIKINLANIMPAPGSGYKVRFAAIKDGKEIGGDTTLVIDLVGKDDPTGLYTIKIRISPEGSDTPSAEEELSQTFGVLKRTSSTTKTLVSVPWGELSATVARDIRVTDIVKTATLDVGDKLHVYDKVSKRYDTWQIDADHQWRPLATYVVNEDGSVSTISAGLPEDRTVARGSAIWLERQDVSKPFYLYGQHVEGTAVADIDRGSVEAPMWNLIASPSLEPFDVRTIKYADPNDQIVVPTEDGPRVYTYKDGVWGTDVNVTETRTMPDGTKVEVVKRSRDTVNTTIPAGVGFWYVSQGGKPTIEW